MHMPDMQDKGVVKDECKQDIMWARGRPTCKREQDAQDEHVDDSGVGADSSAVAESTGQELNTDFDLNDPATWESSLTISEKRFLDQYRDAWPNTAYQLNQDPSSGHGHKAGRHAMFTLINNCGLVWSDTCAPPRWMTATELLMCQGFPVVPFVHEPADHLSVFSFPNEHRNGRHVAAQAGNSMHVAVMALIQIHSLSEIRLQPISQLFKSIHEIRSQVRMSKKRQYEECSDEHGGKSPRVRILRKSDAAAVLANRTNKFNYL